MKLQITPLVSLCKNNFHPDEHLVYHRWFLGRDDLSVQWALLAGFPSCCQNQKIYLRHIQTISRHGCRSNFTLSLFMLFFFHFQNLHFLHFQRDITSSLAKPSQVPQLTWSTQEGRGTWLGKTRQWVDLFLHFHISRIFHIFTFTFHGLCVFNFHLTFPVAGNNLKFVFCIFCILRYHPWGLHCMPHKL